MPRSYCLLVSGPSFHAAFYVLPVTRSQLHNMRVSMGEIQRPSSETQLNLRVTSGLISQDPDQSKPEPAFVKNYIIF